VALLADGSRTTDDIARATGIAPTRLEECRRGTRPLELEQQLRLAAACAGLAPKLERQAHALFAQAQAALRVRADLTRGHMIYPKEHFR
jgi:hypothetical protein